MTSRRALTTLPRMKKRVPRRTRPSKRTKRITNAAAAIRKVPGYYHDNILLDGTFEKSRRPLR